MVKEENIQWHINMITSKDIEQMSDEEFDSFQKQEKKYICEQLNVEYNEDIIFKCGICKHIFTVSNYYNIHCPKCNSSINLKQHLVETLRIIETINASKN